jgi:hydrogenase nickel incorporation protein HypA/HybF
MHEISYALELLEDIEKAAQASDGRVTRVKVKLGLARGVMPENLRRAFEWATVNTLAEGAELEIEVIPIRVHCTLCDNVYVTAEPLDECPHCGSLGGELLGGNEFVIESMEMEEMGILVH